MPKGFRFNLTVKNAEERVNLLKRSEEQQPPPRTGRDLNAHSWTRICCCACVVVAVMVGIAITLAIVHRSAESAPNLSFAIPMTKNPALKARTVRARSPPSSRYRAAAPPHFSPQSPEPPNSPVPPHPAPQPPPSPSPVPYMPPLPPPPGLPVALAYVANATSTAAGAAATTTADLFNMAWSIDNPNSTLVY